MCLYYFRRRTRTGRGTMNIIMIQTTTTREVRVFHNNKWYDVEIDIGVPVDEIVLNMNEQYKLRQERKPTLIVSPEMKMTKEEMDNILKQYRERIKTKNYLNDKDNKRRYRNGKNI